MAEKLQLTEGTVKVYLSRTYGKLGVSSRTQALSQARELVCWIKIGLSLRRDTLARRASF
ncbi:response regulator transcription factor [Cohnella nanjingensis]|uniref:Response regulator transcription factor n=1 Tax=Cohnella nanjingensis TaxID=1387779 RepID=A0A7X0RVG3_9BACL|nr:LuxR C-terminal-related transcriptional regulator [Cohnella nanjingensis]MBB6674418.1 response regulator transcription factor [Cohnella nanjingensis]